jgi:hypothetical protein
VSKLETRQKVQMLVDLEIDAPLLDGMDKQVWTQLERRLKEIRFETGERGRVKILAVQYAGGSVDSWDNP